MRTWPHCHPTVSQYLLQTLSAVRYMPCTHPNPKPYDHVLDIQCSLSADVAACSELSTKLEDVRLRLKALGSQRSEASEAERGASVGLAAAKADLAATARCV